jgi:hypothetical protein
MAAALAATEATKDDMSPQERAAEVGLAVAESASAAGMSLEEQMEARGLQINDLRECNWKGFSNFHVRGF